MWMQSPMVGIGRDGDAVKGLESELAQMMVESAGFLQPGLGLPDSFRASFEAGKVSTFVSVPRKPIDFRPHQAAGAALWRLAGWRRGSTRSCVPGPPG